MGRRDELGVDLDALGDEIYAAGGIDEAEQYITRLAARAGAEFGGLGHQRDLAIRIEYRDGIM